MFLHLVVARDAQIDTALADEGGDVGRWKEDEGDGQVLDESDVEAVLTAKLDVGALEEVQGCREEAALWSMGVSQRRGSCERVEGGGDSLAEGGTHSWGLQRAVGLLGFPAGSALESWRGRAGESRLAGRAGEWKSGRAEENGGIRGQARA